MTFLSKFGAFFCAASFLANIATAQEKKVLDHDVYSIWQNISDERISREGQWALYTLKPQDGDPTLKVRHLRDGREYSVPHGTRGQFTYDATHVVFFLEPSLDDVRLAKKADKKTDELPKNALGILDLATGEVERVERVKSFALPEEAGGWVVWLHEKPVEEEDEEDEKPDKQVAPEEAPQPVGEEPAASEAAPEVEAEAAELSGEATQPVGEEPMPVEPGIEPEPSATPVEPAATEEPTGLAAEPEDPDKDEDEEDDKPEGTQLVLRNLTTGAEQRFEDATEYIASKNGALLVYMASNEEGDADGAFAVAPESGDVVELMRGDGIYKQAAVDESAEQVAFLSNRDTFEEDQPEYRLYFWNKGDGAAEEVVSEETPGLPADWRVGEHRTPWFSEDGSRLYFGTTPRPAPEPDDDTLPPEDEQVKVDVWSWTDDYLQPMQLVQREDEEKRTYLAVRHRRDGRVVQLAGERHTELETAAKGDADVALAESNVPYRKELSWEYPRSHDYYVVDVRTGKARPALEGHLGSAQLSPAGKYVYWWDREQRAWFAKPTRGGGDAVNLTGGLRVAFDDEDNDRPMTPDAYGDAGWTDNDDGLIVYDRYDLWRLDPRGKKTPVNLTDGVGRADNRRFRVVDLDPDQDFLPKDLLLRAFDYGTRSWGFYEGRSDEAAPPERLLFDAKLFGEPKKADDAEVYLLTRESFEEFPDLWWTDDTFSALHRVSEANPQQAEYRWGTAELVSWDSVNGERLEGILYKPEDFDPEQKYPLLVYFYERLSERLHAHHAPEANRASINASFYVSRGYCVFMPDIPYRLGYPGESALHAVVPGVLSLLEQGFVDRDRIGLQGHSWGGYQTAYIITQTPMFAAAEAGAPVSNMISAYGGIRWETGMSRMFQYERTQSRIGEPLWDAPLHYIENSPIFFADKVETPLLMLHNDADGAVPWYQGIELFTALRRLDKPVWLLNYNGEAHGLTKTHNKIDWAQRMQQFFDHYLMGAPAPVWMTEGVSAVEKGKTLGLEVPSS